MNKKIDKISPEKLILLSGDIFYEVQMYLYSLNKLRQLKEKLTAHGERARPLTPLEQFLRNLYIESICIHSRNLLYFFYKREKRSVTAWHYFADWDMKCPFQDENHNKKRLSYIKRVNSHVAHILIRRAEGENDIQKWNKQFDFAYKHIRDSLVVFIEITPQEYLCDRFKDGVQMMISRCRF